jgi:Uma2 family endonuclease
MTTATAPAATPKLATAATAFVPRPIYWTMAEFHTLWDRGFFTGTRRAILVDGVILEMPNPDPPHDFSLTQAHMYLMAAFAVGHYVRNQQGFHAALDTDPGPDLAVVVGTPRDYLTAHPTTAVLIVEVANSSLAYDRREKAHIYAAAGVPEYWVLDIVGRQLLIFRDPIPDAAALRGHRYATQTTHADTDSVSPQAAPAAVVAIAALLP